MSVYHVHVITCVQTLLAVLSVHVEVGLCWIPMGYLVMVSPPSTVLNSATFVYTL